MKLALIILGSILVAILWGALMTLAFPPPFSTLLSMISGWVFGRYIFGPILLGDNK